MVEKSSLKTIRFFNKSMTVVFVFLSILFIVLMAVNREFFEWTFMRHQNTLSWYIRPIFLIPICYFSYRRNPLGIAITIFLMFTSMFWFSKPAVVDEKVAEFLAMEREYLTMNWTISKLAVTMIVPISMVLLCMAFWKHSLKLGLLVMVGIAIGKIIWSVTEGGDSGQKVIIPALLGLVLCIVLVYIGFRYFEKRKN